MPATHAFTAAVYELPYITGDLNFGYTSKRARIQNMLRAMSLDEIHVVADLLDNDPAKLTSLPVLALRIAFTIAIAIVTNQKPTRSDARAVMTLHSNHQAITAETIRDELAKGYVSPEYAPTPRTCNEIARMASLLRLDTIDRNAPVRIAA